MADSQPRSPSYDTGPLAGKPIPGMVQRGNIDVNHRPGITNADGSHSSIFSMTVPIGKDGSPRSWDAKDINGYALVPSIANGKFLTPDGKKPDEKNKAAMEQLEGAATDYYGKTRQHLGIFKSDKDADTYAGQTHAWVNDGSSKALYAPSYDADENGEPKAKIMPSNQQQPADPYASIAKPIQGGADPYANMGDAPAAPPDNRNAFQKSIDTTLSTPSKGPMALDQFGRGAAGAIMSPIAHPVEAAKGMAHAMQPDAGAAGLAEGLIGGPAGPLMAHTAKGLYDDYKQNGLAHALGNVAGSFAGGEATGGMIGRIGRGAEAAAPSINNALIGTKVSDVEHGANPGSALAKNHIVGSTPNSLLAGVKDAIPDVSAAHRSTIQQFSPPGAKINVGRISSDPFDQEVSSATDPTTGVSTPTQVSRARQTQRLLSHVQDPDTGQVTPMMRDPNLSPLDATDLKSSIYKMTNYDDPYKSSLANSGLKQAAHGLKQGVEQLVPQSVESGQRLHDLMAAKDLLTQQSQSTHLVPASRSGLVERGVLGAGTRAAAGLDAVSGPVEGLGTAGRFITAPLLATGKNKNQAGNQ